MNSRKIVFHETGIVAIGVAVCTGIMYGVFTLLGKFDLSVLLGGLTGAVLSVLNFFFMAVSSSLAADKAENQDVKGGQALIQRSYLIRLAVLFVLLFACAKSGYFNAIALVLPLIFVQPTITIAEFFRKSGDDQK